MRSDQRGVATTHNFNYDAHNRLTNGFGKSYAYDNLGRLTNYEGATSGVNSGFPLHAVKNSGYSYDANGNLTRRWDPASSQWQRPEWNHENRLSAVKNDAQTQTIESYLYDADGIRVKKVSGSTTTYYPFPHYEVSNGVVTKYYFFNGQRVAMRQNGVLYYLHPEHLGGNLFATNTSGAKSSVQGYYAYGKTRWGNLQTDHRFTGQKYDNTGLYYFNARYYDPAIGTFISPDTFVPDPTNVWDYNRFAYGRLNPLKYNDPTGHCATLDDSSPDLVNDAGCWDAAEEYRLTFGIGDYKNVDQWRQYFASNASITEQILRTGLYHYWHPLYTQWGIYHPQYNPPPQWNEAPPPPGVVETMKAVHYTLLYQCAVAVTGACGVSYGRTGIAPGAAGRVSGDFYVDYNGDVALFGTIGAGPAVMLFPQPMASQGFGAVAVPNTDVSDVGGWSVQIGGSGAFGVGPALDLVVALGETAPTGVAVGTAYGTWNAEGHVIIAYSQQLYSSKR